MSSRFAKTATILTISAALLLVACSSSIVKSLTDMARLRQQLIDKYHDPDVNINLAGGNLNIAFVNSPLNQQDRVERWQRARATATFVAEHYPKGGIKNIWVGFVEYHRRLILFYYTRSIDGFMFDPEGVPVESTSP